jgi:nicotinamidase-related amidase
MKLIRPDTMLVVIDVQEKLMPVIDQQEQVLRNIERMVRGCAILDVPMVLTEQYAQGLGPTVEVLRKAFEESGGYRPIEKATFSAWSCSEFTSALRALKRKHVLIAGVETHVCVYQTVADLISVGHLVTVIADAVSSRTKENREIGLRRMESEGARLSSTEMALFELTGRSGTEEFRSIAKLIR